MKQWAVLLLVAMATPVGAWTTVLEDDAGDVQVRLADQAEQAERTGRSSATDLLALEIEEDDAAFRFRVRNDGWTQGPQTVIVDEGQYWVLWRYRDTDYGVSFRRLQGDGPQMDALLARIDDGVPTRIGELTFELQDDAVEFEVPRLSIIDSRGASPRPGEELADVEVLSFGASTLYLANGDDVRGQGDQAMLRSWDFMGPPTPWPVQAGVAQDGELELWSPDPMRISNGAAGALVFDARLTSHGGPHTANIAVQDVPPQWDVALPFGTVEVPAGGEVRVPIVVSVPFAHAHGARQTFLLTATDGAHVGRLEVGVLFTSVPQPAGHHDTLFIHTDHGPAFSLQPGFDTVRGGDTRARAFMNTLEDDPDDTGTRVPSDGIIIAGYDHSLTWAVPLRPGLAMGIDLANGTGEIEVPIQYDYLATGVRLEGDVRINNETIAQLRPGPAQDITRGEARLTATVHPSADRIAYNKGHELVLHLVATGTFNGPYPGPDTAAHLVSGGWLRMPLEEYQDAPESLATPEIRVVADASRRLANPGDAVLFRLDVATQSARDLVVRVDGQNAAWARAEPERLRVDGTSSFLVAVGVPPDAALGDVADLVVAVSDAQDATLRSIGRVTVSVTDTPVDSDPEAEALLDPASTNRSPAPLWLLGALAAVAWRRRASAP